MCGSEGGTKDSLAVGRGTGTRQGARAATLPGLPPGPAQGRWTQGGEGRFLEVLGVRTLCASKWGGAAEGGLREVG
eukprot:COSAG02_NODE_3102_length_7368_cov_92.599120_5_plen_76_part_00